VGESLKGALLIAETLSSLGYACNPPRDQLKRTDIIQAVTLGEREKVLAFCQAVQRCSPVGANVRLEAGRTPGYGDEVVFADGTFIDGSTLELSADGPLREPYAVYMQGGTHWTHWSIVLREACRTIGAAGEAEGAGSEAAEKAEAEGERYAGRRGLKNS
tara:strand:- start:204 stop:683 length:480 start_codon:yes stop_codon:yes gene_type:complete